MLEIVCASKGGANRTANVQCVTSNNTSTWVVGNYIDSIFPIGNTGFILSNENSISFDSFIAEIQSCNPSCAISGNSDNMSLNLGLTINNQDDIFMFGRFKGTLFTGQTGIQLYSDPASDVVSYYIAKIDDNICGISHANKFTTNLVLQTTGTEPNIKINDNRKLFLVGSFEDKIFLDAPTGIMKESSHIDLFIADINPDTCDIDKVLCGGITGDTGANIFAVLGLDGSDINNENLYITGNFAGKLFPDSSAMIENNQSVTDLFVIKIDIDSCEPVCSLKGNINGERASGQSIAVNNSNELFISGIFRGTLFDGITGIEINSEPGATGSNNDLFLAKLDPVTCEPMCVTIGESTGTVINTTVTINDSNELYIGGTFTGTLFPNGGTGITIHSDNIDIFIAKVDPTNCKILYAIQGNSNNISFIRNITNNNGVYTGGSFSGTLFPGTNNEINAENEFNVDSFIAQFNCIQQPEPQPEPEPEPEPQPEPSKPICLPVRRKCCCRHTSKTYYYNWYNKRVCSYNKFNNCFNRHIHILPEYYSCKNNSNVYNQYQYYTCRCRLFKKNK